MERPNHPILSSTGGLADPAKPCYFMLCGRERRGPFTLAQMTEAGLLAGTMVWRVGFGSWTHAGDVPELSEWIAPAPSNATSPALDASVSSPATPPHATAIRTGVAYHAGHVLASFARLDLKREVWPLNGTAARTMASDPAFWCVTLLAALPLLFCSFGTADQSLTAFSLFFSGVWALIFCYVIQGECVGWGWRIGCLFATGILGIGGLQLLYEILPDWYVGLTTASTFPVRLAGYIGQVGLLEEATKIVPVALLASLLRRRLLRVDIVVLGVFSGLGFAAFENLHYFHNQLDQSVGGAVDTVVSASNNAVTRDAAAGTLMNAAYLTMLLPLARSLSSPFSHACWSGIFAHFVGAAVRPEAKGRRVALVACGWAIAATLHGLYDALANVQVGFSAAIAVLSFMLLRLYLAGTAEPPAVLAVNQASQPLEAGLG